MTCESCRAGPSGIEGHEAMGLDPQQHHPSPTFRCSRCGGRYLREYEGGGVFVWVRIEESNP